MARRRIRLPRRPLPPGGRGRRSFAGRFRRSRCAGRDGCSLCSRLTRMKRPGRPAERYFAPFPGRNFRTGFPSPAIRSAPTAPRWRAVFRAKTRSRRAWNRGRATAIRARPRFGPPDRVSRTADSMIPVHHWRPARMAGSLSLERLSRSAAASIRRLRQRRWLGPRSSSPALFPGPTAG